MRRPSFAAGPTSASTYFHRRVIHMIVFSRPPGWKRRAGDPGSAGGFAEASVWTSSSGGDALRRPRKATLRAALQAFRTSSRGPCDAPRITADHAPGLKNPQGRQMCHPPMKVSTGALSGQREAFGRIML